MASRINRMQEMAAQAGNPFFSGAETKEDRERETVSDSVQSGNATVDKVPAQSAEPVKAAGKASQTATVFSFRASHADSARWKAYAKARQGMTLAEIGAAAMDEYMERHALTAAEVALYDLEMRRADMLKSL